MSNTRKTTSQSTKLATSAAQKRVVTFLSPNGKEFNTSNLTAFAKRFNLDSSSLSKLINGSRVQYKNWTLKSVA